MSCNVCAVALNMLEEDSLISKIREVEVEYCALRKLRR